VTLCVAGAGVRLIALAPWDAEFVTDLTVRDLELDEQWSFAGQKKAALESCL
jgi:hypothetical protein